MHFFFGVTWLSTVFAPAPQVQKSPFSFLLSLATIRSLSKILACAHLVQATTLNLGRQCDKDESLLSQNYCLGLGRQIVNKRTEWRMLWKRERNTHCAGELEVWGAERPFKLGGQENLTKGVTFQRRSHSCRNLGTRPRTHVMDFYWGL